MRAARLLGVLVAVGATGLGAQQDSLPRPSQHGTVSQTVNRTDIRVEYDRPVARGRRLFGGIVDWDAIWTPGANRATWIDFSTPVTFEGHSLDKGRYGIWLVPHESEPWEVVLVRNWDTAHGFFPFGTEALRTKVSPKTREHMETLAFYFPVVGPYETVLWMHWGITVLPLHIAVPH